MVSYLVDCQLDAIRLGVLFVHGDARIPQKDGDGLVLQGERQRLSMPFRKPAPQSSLQAIFYKNQAF